jgi:hypothetical protein
MTFCLLVDAFLIHPYPPDGCADIIFSSIFGLPTKGCSWIQDEKVFADDKFVRHRAVGARLIHASTHARLRWWGAIKLLPSALTCPLSRSVAISIAEGSRALHIPY